MKVLRWECCAGGGGGGGWGERDKHRRQCESKPQHYSSGPMVHMVQPCSPSFIASTVVRP